MYITHFLQRLVLHYVCITNRKMTKTISIRLTQEQDEILNALFIEAKKEYKNKGITKSDIIRQLINKAGEDSFNIIMKKIAYYDGILMDLKDKAKELREHKFNKGFVAPEVEDLLEI